MGLGRMGYLLIRLASRLKIFWEAPISSILGVKRQIDRPQIVNGCCISVYTVSVPDKTSLLYMQINKK
ncbi:hypothetical protein HMPREF1640_06000 [Prevotella sp. S7-1-8]|nr:hypothetical protein HMPREF1640_06000 [Prevotella sp. S7-1-8]